MSGKLRVSSKSSDSHPFGGCNKLQGQYQMVGVALLEYERSSATLLPPLILPSRRILSQFSVSVSFVPVEVLESYLEDLLDLGVKDQSLFIERNRSRSRAVIIATSTVLLAALAAMAFSAENVIPHSLTAILMAFMAVVGATFLLLRPRVLRRFAFAQVLSQEISSRRGTTRPFRPALASEFEAVS